MKVSSSPCKIEEISTSAQLLRDVDINNLPNLPSHLQAIFDQVITFKILNVARLCLRF